jgi:hypothetical protein
MEPAQITNEELRLSQVPLPDASWYEIADFARTYDGYKESGSFEACACIANEGPQETLHELRVSLFFEWRRAHHGGRDPAAKELDHIRDLVRRIRACIA